MTYFSWNTEKNSKLFSERGISFESVVFCIENGNLLAVLDHPNSKKYPNQKLFIVEIHKYVYIVPFVENDEEVFLKTIIPSRKATKKYLGGKL